MPVLGCGLQPYAGVTSAKIDENNVSVQEMKLI
jgi:hypothetical protein